MGKEVLNRWFEDAQVDEEVRSVEVPSRENFPIERILLLATKFAAVRYISRAFLFHGILTWHFRRMVNAWSTLIKYSWLIRLW